MIDMLRFIAALMVVLFHLNQSIPVQDNWYRNLVKYGYLGVPVFFVVSGYCILLSAYGSANIQDFLSKRLFRIYPAYWVSLIIVVFAACFQKLYTGFNSVQSLPKTPVSMLANIFLATSPLNHIKTINWVYWSLTCELFFYFTVAMLLLLHKQVIIYAIAGISLLAAIIPAQHTGVLFFLDHWPAFGIGISLFYYLQDNGRRQALLSVILFAVNVVGLFVTSVYNWEYKIAGLLAFSLIFLSSYIRIPKNFFATLGQYSYSVYLIHVPVGVYILSSFESKAIQINPLFNFIYDLTVYIIVSLLAVVMYKLVEKPGITYGRKFTQRYLYTSHKKYTA